MNMLKTDPDKFVAEFANYIHPNLEIRMTKDKGRGVFATKLIEPGELIFAEKPIAMATDTALHEYVLDSDKL